MLESALAQVILFRMSEEKEQERILPSDFIPGYELKEQIGKGGMGVVYKARQQSPEREVAVKIISDELNKNPKYVARFEREAKIAIKLNHKNIVAVFNTGVSQGHHYYAMEYVDGISLADMLHLRKIIPEKEALAIIEEVTEALEQAEKYKIVHRDIKPGNIMMTQDGHAKLCDLGLAKQTEGEFAATTLTTTGDVVGTPYYMSPEQLDGIELDIRTDIYALGVVLYELVTGDVPFPGTTSTEIITKKITKEPTPPVKLNPKVSQNTNDLILRMMARKRADRYENPSHLLRVIQYIKQGFNASALPTPFIDDLAKAEALLAKGDLDSADQIISKAPLVYAGTNLMPAVKMAADKMLEEIYQRKAKAGGFLNSARAKIESGDYRGAIEECNKAIELNAKFAEAYSRRGYAKEQIMDIKEAKKDYDKAISIAPSFAQPKAKAPASKRGLIIFLCGALLYPIIHSIGFLDLMFYYITCIVHELGHCIMDIAFGIIPIPAFDFAHGGGETLGVNAISGGRFVIIGILLLLIFLSRENRPLMICLIVGAALYPFLAFTAMKDILIYAGGHLGEAVGIYICFYRCAFAGNAKQFERPLYSIIGWWMIFFGVGLCWNIIFSDSYRCEYVNDPIRYNDLIKIADITNWNLGFVAALFAIFYLIPIAYMIILIGRKIINREELM